MDTQNEQEKRGEENKKESDEAMRLAHDQQERDRLAGQRPVTAEVADSIAEKLKTKYGTDGTKGLADGEEIQ